MIVQNSYFVFIYIYQEKSKLEFLFQYLEENNYCFKFSAFKL